MIDAAIFQDIVDTTIYPILLTKKNNTNSNFEIIYQNTAFQKLTNNIQTNDSSFLETMNKFSDLINWQKIVDNTFSSTENQELTFYSPLLSNWFEIIFSKLENDYLVLILHNNTSSVEHENQLKNQNIKLECLTEELEISKQSLKNKLENIETLNKKLQQVAFYDSLTALPNRASFSDKLQDILRQARKDKSLFGIMLIDIDNFKNINDTLGHIAGDAVLSLAGKQLKLFQREDIQIFRFGGDEFLVLAKNIASKDSMLTIADTIFESLTAVNIQISAGISLYPDDSEDADELLKFADMALYDVKQKGKNNVFFFHYVMKEKFLGKIQLETKLQQALNSGLFQLYYQPQVDITTNSLRGFEALLRWYDKDIGWISPEKFIPIAEESRLVIPLGSWVLETACRTLANWQKNFNFKGIMSVNVSPIQIKKPGFLDELLDVINKYDIYKPSLEIEITEGILIENFAEILPILQTIKDLGIGLSLDDFGTGYSSLSYLQILPLTTLKIDKSFVENITQKNSIESEITSAIISLVTKMGLDTIAEGVENEEQLEVLINKKCKNTQGFLMGKPMPEEVCEKMLDGDESAILRIDTGRQPIRYSI